MLSYVFFNLFMKIGVHPKGVCVYVCVCECVCVGGGGGGGLLTPTTPAANTLIRRYCFSIIFTS